jgi:hypothetical protein
MARLPGLNAQAFSLMRLSQVVRNQSLSACPGVGNIYSISGNADGSASSFMRLLSCITVVSLPVDIDPNLGDHKETRNVDSPNKNGHKETRLNLREKLRQDCKTFIHRFDSDRRLQITLTQSTDTARTTWSTFGLNGAM